MNLTTTLVILVFVIIISAICYIIISTGNRRPKPSFLATDDKYYEQIGIHKGHTDVWEDGLRTDGGAGSNEWWYVDSKFEDGTMITTMFYTKDGFDVSGPAQPTATIDITYPDGTVVREKFSEDPGTIIDASTEKCDVQIGDSYLRHVGDEYQIKYVAGDVVYEATMASTNQMWRPATGHWLFGDKQEYFFAWFVAQPSSVINGTLKVGDTTTELYGTGYHDHNWGNIALNEVIDHWYWGRAIIGNFNVIMADIVSGAAYGYTRMPVILIAKDGEVIADNQENLVIERSDTIQHPETTKFMDNHLTFILAGENNIEYRVEYIRENDFFVASFLDALPTWKKTLAKLIGANPTYVRTSGEVVLSILDGDNATTIKQEGLCNQMSFGKFKEAQIGNS